jgi:hypothetical protein
MNRHEVQVAITGAQVSPEDVSLRELVAVLGRLDAAIQAFAAEKLEVPEGVSVSLVDIRPGSESLVFSVPDPLLPAVAVISSSFRDRDFSQLPKAAYKELYELSETVTRRGWGLEIREQPEAGIPYASLTPDAPLVPPMGPVYLKGTSTVHGRCLRVGGSTKPRAEIRLSNGELLNVDLSEALAKELAPQLYEEVALEGTATWNPDTWEIESFRVTEVLPYRKTDPALAFRELAEAAGGRWDEVDPVEYVRSLRDEE